LCVGRLVRLLVLVISSSCFSLSVCVYRVSQQRQALAT
jgi:hypothetical protein